jgi:hypothetical protein
MICTLVNMYSIEIYYIRNLTLLYLSQNVVLEDLACLPCGGKERDEDVQCYEAAGV